MGGGRTTSTYFHLSRASFTVKLVPLKQLPTSIETADALFTHVSHHFCLPEDIVSDWGPQFIPGGSPTSLANFFCIFICKASKNILRFLHLSLSPSSIFKIFRRKLNIFASEINEWCHWIVDFLNNGFMYVVFVLCKLRKIGKSLWSQPTGIQFVQ